MKSRIWITWENQRRSIELAKHFGCELFIVDYKGKGRYFLSIAKTLQILFKKKPEVLFVQNPSMVLAAVACLYGIVTRVPVVVDRHSNFMLTNKKRSALYVVVFSMLNYLTIKFASLTIITNKYIADIVKENRGTPFILPDKIPTLQKSKDVHLDGKYNFLVISSFAADEPIGNVIEAFNTLDESFRCYITGNCKKADRSLIESASERVVFTGFLAEQDYMDMVFAVDGIIVLTEVDYTMLCGCYEATYACKPLITSDKSVLTDYFRGALFIDNSAESIRSAVIKVSENLNSYTDSVKLMKQELVPRWDEMSRNLERLIQKFECKE